MNLNVFVFEHAKISEKANRVYCPLEFSVEYNEYNAICIDI